MTDGQRRIFVNLDLPAELLDEDGNPVQQFSRNKIRTARYTPLTFIPKNLWLQFHNVANVYFLFVTILAFFPIFGATNPEIGSIPLIVILLITAIKDAIEDYRRTVLDNELNNTPVYILTGWNNPNVTDESISLWRRVKKTTSRIIRLLIKRLKNSPTRAQGVNALERSITNASIQTANTQGRDSIQMTPVPPKLEGEMDARTHFNGVPCANSDGGRPMRNHIARSLFSKNKDSESGERTSFTRKYWKDVRVGDFVRIYNDDEIPADIVILSTSNDDGSCYIETKNLDGETNLKVRHALKYGRSLRRAQDCKGAAFAIESEPPHANLYAYSAVLRWPREDEGDLEEGVMTGAEPVTINNLLLRGCTMRNTKWVIGVVVFTGDDTKIMMNAGITPSKRSRITRQLNWNVIINFIILLAMCIVSGIVQGVTWGRGSESLNFFEYGSIGGSPPIDGIITFWTAVILFQNLVPISLYISIEIIKLAQAFFIYSDVNMYYEPIDYPCTPKSWNISDDLGQIEYIFSDKTGTLTQNVMEFKKCTVNGKAYGETVTEVMTSGNGFQGRVDEDMAETARKKVLESKQSMIQTLRATYDNPYLANDSLTFISPQFAEDLKDDSDSKQTEAVHSFMLSLAICHTVLPERSSSGIGPIAFKAQSPDEAALVATASDCGFTLIERRNDGVLVDVHGSKQFYEVLNVLEFSSARKRMSVIVRMPDSGDLVLFCKGADSVIYSRLKPGEQVELRQTTAQHLESFAREGLRTLCVAQRVLQKEEYDKWNIQYQKAAAAISDRENKIEEVADLLEGDLMLLGGTAIEDKLQDGVPETIALLAEAGIKLWVLTGDKVETAINIGFSCNLLTDEMELILLKAEDMGSDAGATLSGKLNDLFGLEGTAEEVEKAKSDHNLPELSYALVIDGEALKLALEDDVKLKFLLLCKQCRAVICCRVSPSQKAAVVQMVKTGLDVMTLSVGDGANDVAMIQEADVGVGIAGEEGRQAVMSSDYAIAQFRFLGRLVLVHGRWSYQRLAEMIANFFYTNIVWTFALFWYQLYNNFDGTYLFEYTYILLYNLAFTSLPIIWMGISDQDVSDTVSLLVPQLYRRGILRKEWTQKKFWLYMADGIFQSLVCFFTTYLLFANGDFLTKDGQAVNGREQMGVYVACATVFVANIYVLINQYRWDWLFVLIVSVSTLLVWIWTAIFSQFQATAAFYKTVDHVFGAATFWAISLLTVTVSLLPRFAAKAIQKLYYPRDVDIIRERVRMGYYEYVNTKGSHYPVSGSERGRELQKGTASRTYNEEDERPFYPPSVAPTAATTKRGSKNGSDGTSGSEFREFGTLTPQNRFSLDERNTEPYFPAFERISNYEKVRASMERSRSSFEASSEFTSAAMLARMESSHTGPRRWVPMVKESDA